MSLPSLEAKLVLDSAGFQRGIEQASSAVNKFTGVIGIAAAATAGFLAYRATGLIKNQMDLIDSTAKLADRLGATTQELGALQYAGDLAGVSSEQLQTSLTKLAQTIENAGTGSAAAVDSLAKLGLAYDDLVNLSPTRQLEALADGLVKVGNAGDRTAIAMEIFGKSGSGMVNLLADGATGLRDAAKEAEQLGLVFSRFDAAKVEQANDALTKIGKVIDSVLIEAAIKFAPIIEALSNEFLSWVKSFGGLGKVAGMALDVIAEKMRPVLIAMDVLNLAFSTFKSFFSTTLGIAIYMLEQVSIAVSYLVSLFTYNLPEAIKAGVQIFKAVMLTVGPFVAAVFGEAINWVAGKFEELTNFISEKMSGSMMFSAFSGGVKELGKSVNEFVKKNAITIGEAADYAKTAWTDVAKTATAVHKEAADSATNNLLTKSLSNAKLKLAEWMAESKTGVTLAWQGLFGDSEGAGESLRKWFEKIDAVSDEAARKTEARSNALIDEMKRKRMELESARFAPAAFPQADPMGRSDVDKFREELGMRAQVRRESLEAQAADESWFTETFGREAERRKTWEQMTNRERVSSTQWMLGNMSTLMNSHSKKMFQLGKVAAIANAIVSTAQGAAKALELGFPMGPIAMAAVIAAGAVQIATIQRTQFGGGGSVSSAGGNIALAGGEPAGVLATQTGVTGNAQNNINITFTGLSDNQLLTGAQVRQLIDQLNEAGGDGARVATVNLA